MMGEYCRLVQWWRKVMKSGKNRLQFYFAWHEFHIKSPRLEPGRTIITTDGAAVAQAISSWVPTAGGPGSRPGSVWDLCWTKRHWGRFTPSTSVSHASHHSTNFAIIIITRGWHSRPICGRSAVWTQYDTTLHNFYYLFELQMGFHPVAVLRQ
jgi:hypothetical protein